ncbi:MAG: V-type ATP synthase subunit K [Candidatus Izemoplasmatales bacterium]|nr:V-type ATP synthase subunit K [Candidatus Izemoplasmatales bacterium]
MSDNYGLFYAILGAALVASLGGFGSALGVQMGGKAAAGVTSEKPELFGKLLILQALPGTQGIYGFLIAVLVLINCGVLSGTPQVAKSIDTGLSYFAACLPGIIVLPISAYFQAKMSVSSINMVAKQPDSSGKGITMTVLVETYAVLALLASILMVTGI